MIDLHCHSTFSDGLLSPESLIKSAKEAKVRVLALTDHDTTLGLSALREVGKSSDIVIIDGIELSTRWKTHDIHVVGLHIDPQCVALQACIDAQMKCRTERALHIGERLRHEGVRDAYDKAREIAGHDRVSRPHFAAVLMQEGIVKDTHAAFKQYLARGKPAYVETAWVPLPEIVHVIHEAGGLSVLAHPLKYKLTRTKLNALISAFQEAGGVGIEVISGWMTPMEIADMAALSQQYKLLASTGSDFHGEAVSRVGLGRQPRLPACCTPIWVRWGLH